MTNEIAPMLLFGIFYLIVPGHNYLDISTFSLNIFCIKVIVQLNFVLTNEVRFCSYKK